MEIMGAALGCARQAEGEECKDFIAMSKARILSAAAATQDTVSMINGAGLERGLIQAV